MYLLNPNKLKSSAHLWLNDDTVCRMFKSGGMRKDKQIVSESAYGKPICTMCMNNLKKLPESYRNQWKEHESQPVKRVVKQPEALSLLW